MKVLVPVKRVIDYNVKVRVKADGSVTKPLAWSYECIPRREIPRNLTMPTYLLKLFHNR